MDKSILRRNIINLYQFIKEYYYFILSPFIIVVFFLVYFNNQIEKDDIKENLTMTYGKIYGSSNIYKKYSKRNFRYKFTFDGKIYTGTSTGYITDGVKEGKIYKVEFSKENPRHNRMIFDIEYEQRLILDQKGQVADTSYVQVGQKFRNKMKEIVEEYKFKTDSIKN
ncbi:hypothetical protein [Flavivirga spongiicola]|uniref:Uncharacterized protein n=1 Tax=Flavivirga spongiicola TaxID=421621 RepID=A0ABU7XU99_9FLAO|nr:hypothetical protein [Flavivirga sp. MEBiC05379]MDO5979334.1 hypothetical protein [Flavivirga sp. MEBiC05379]